MTYKIDPRKVAGVVTEANTAIGNRGFNHGEVALGLAELLGRVMVESCVGPQQLDDLKKAVTEHLERTVKIGAHARGVSTF